MSEEWGVGEVKKPEDVRKFLSAEALEIKMTYKDVYVATAYVMPNSAI